MKRLSSQLIEAAGCLSCSHRAPLDRITHCGLSSQTPEATVSHTLTRDLTRGGWGVDTTWFIHWQHKQLHTSFQKNVTKSTPQIDLEAALTEVRCITAPASVAKLQIQSSDESVPILLFHSHTGRDNGPSPAGITMNSFYLFQITDHSIRVEYFPSLFRSHLLQPPFLLGLSLPAGCGEKVQVFHWSGQTAVHWERD